MDSVQEDLIRKLEQIQAEQKAKEAAAIATAMLAEESFLIPVTDHDTRWIIKKLFLQEKSSGIIVTEKNDISNIALHLLEINSHNVNFSVWAQNYNVKYIPHP